MAYFAATARAKSGISLVNYLKFGTLLLLLVSVGQPVMAETVYVNDIVRLGVRGNQDNKSRPLAIVITGTALEILEKENNYYKIKTPKGSVGWVLKAYVSSEPPAKVLLPELQERFDLVNQELQEYEARVGEIDTQNVLLADKLASATMERNRLTEELAAFSRQVEASRKNFTSTWSILSGFGAGIALVAFTLGALWYRRRAMRKLGGLSI